VWHVSSRSGVATLRTAIHLLLTYSLRGRGGRSQLLLLTLTPNYFGHLLCTQRRRRRAEGPVLTLTTTAALYYT